MTFDNLSAFLRLCAYLIPELPGIAPSVKWWLLMRMAAYAVGMLGGVGVLLMAADSIVRGWRR